MRVTHEHAGRRGGRRFSPSSADVTGVRRRANSPKRHCFVVEIERTGMRFHTEAVVHLSVGKEFL